MLLYIFELIGAFVYWAIFKFRGNYYEQLLKENEKRNYNMGLFAFVIVIVGIVLILVALKTFFNLNTI
jgi:uncharacterized Tic20 family protein